MDIGDTIAPDSDQMDAVDLRSSGPQTFTVERVVIKPGDQPVNVYLKEFPRPWRPGKSMRRVLDGLWGPSAGGVYEGRRLLLFCDDRVKFGGEAIGGVRIKAMSHIGGEKRGVSLIVSRGNVKVYTVEPLPDDAPQGGASPDGITDAHERVIRGQMKRTGIDGARVLELAQQASGRVIGSARDLTSVEADALIVLLSDLPDAQSEES